MNEVRIQFDNAPTRILVDGVEWKPADAGPVDPPPPNRIKPAPAPPIGTPIPTFAEAGLKQPQFAPEKDRRIFAIRPWETAFDNTDILKHVGMCMWGTPPGTPSGDQLRQLAPWVWIPGYTILPTSIEQHDFELWSEWAEGNSIDPKTAILKDFTAEDGKDGGEMYWVNIFDDNYREWAFYELKKLSERDYHGVLCDIGYSDNPPNGGGVQGREKWQQAVGSFIRECHKHWFEPKGKSVCINVSGYRADRCETVSKCVGGLYLDRSFVKSELNVYNLDRACVWNENHRKEWPDYWSIQDSHASDGNDPKWKMGDYCRWLIRMSVLGGWQGKHFFATRNNDAGAVSHSKIAAEHFVPAAVMYDMGKPVAKPSWPQGFNAGVLHTRFEGGDVYTLATKDKSEKKIGPHKLTFLTEREMLHYDSWSTGTEYTLEPGEGLVVKA